ncbi:MAG TPA: hypothetical protein P5255_13960 [Phycisphaerae bacterium]|nr:hypothetical protein [Phycisphaerae bacterium]
MEYAYSTPNGIRHYRRYGEGRRAYWTKLVREILWINTERTPK